MADVYKQQAQYFANVPLMQRNIIASVHIEDGEDKTFWNAMLQSHHPGLYYFITHSRSPKGNETSGCEQCLKYRPYLSQRFFICIDSDMRYLLQEADLDAGHFICQTYTYSWENHYCEAISLQQRFKDGKTELAKTFDFPTFLSELSSVAYKPLLLLLYCMRNDKSEFNQRMFNACIPKQCRREELADNGKALIERIKKNFERYLETTFAQAINFEEEAKKYLALNLTKQNAYLHIRGHNLFDLVAHIGDLVSRGTSVSFKQDVLLKDLSPQNYWQIKKVASDIAAII